MRRLVAFTDEQIRQLKLGIALLALQDGHLIRSPAINGDAQYAPRQHSEAHARLLASPEITAVLDAAFRDPDHFVKLVQFERDFPLPSPSAPFTAEAHDARGSPGSTQPSDLPLTPDGGGCVEDSMRAAGTRASGEATAVERDGSMHAAVASARGASGPEVTSSQGVSLNLESVA